MTDAEIRALAERLFLQDIQSHNYKDLPPIYAEVARRAISMANLFDFQWRQPDRHRWGVQEYLDWRGQQSGDGK